MKEPRGDDTEPPTPDPPAEIRPVSDFLPPLHLSLSLHFETVCTEDKTILLAHGDAPWLVGALVGALFAMIGTLFVQFIVGFVLPLWRRNELTRLLSVEAEPGHLGNITCIVHNGFQSTLNNVAGHVKIGYSQEDVLDYDGRPDYNPAPHIHPDRYVEPVFRPVCWGHYAEKDRNPVSLSIRGGEGRDLLIGRIVDDAILIASECSLRPARVALERKKYSGELQLFSDEANPVAYSITIDPDANLDKVLKLTPLKN